MTTLHRTKSRFGRPRFLQVFLVTLAVLIAGRLVLPLFVSNYVLTVLNRLPDYRATIDDLDLNLWRGAYELEGVVIDKVRGGEPEPFLSVRLMDLSIQWLALARGRLVGEVVLHQPVLQGTFAKREEEAETGSDQPWLHALRELFPFRIDRLVVRDGELHLKNVETKPKVDLFMTDFYLEALNLTNVRNEADALVAVAEAAGRPFGVGEFEARLHFDPTSDVPRFDLDAEARKIPVIELNDFLQAYGNVDAEAGTFGLFAEFAAEDGRIDGYVKTLFEGLKLLSFREIDDAEDALEFLWEGLVHLASEVFENQPHDRLATKVQLSGEYGHAQADMGAVIANLLRNALIVALRPAIDDSVRLDMLTIERRRAP